MLSLLGNEIKRSWIIYKRYPLEAISSIVALLILFAGLVLGAEIMGDSGSSYGSRLESAIVGYVVWMLVAGPFSGVSNFIQTDAKTGVLEQLFLTRRNFVVIATARSVASIIVNLVGIVIVLAVVLVATRTSLDVRPSIIGPVLFAVVAATGLGLCAASITLLAKKTQTLVGVATIGLLFLVMAPLEKYLLNWIIVLLPIVPNSVLLREILVNGAEPSYLEILVGALNSGAYYVLGWLSLSWSIKKAKRDGKLAGY